jgi:hypothetical protein
MSGRSNVNPPLLALWQKSLPDALGKNFFDLGYPPELAERLYETFVAAVGYLGFTKSSLVSVSDVFRLTDLSVPEFKYSLVWYAFMTFVVVTTVLWGRVYCGRVCAFGAM